MSQHIENYKSLLDSLGIREENESICTGTQWVTPLGSEKIESKSPIDNSLIAKVILAQNSEYEHIIKLSSEAFKFWRNVPAPERGNIIRQLGNKLRIKKKKLGKLVSIEMGKSLQEGYGEVQEMIDICDFAVGLSRQLYGKTFPSERPNHRIMEQWHPLGTVGIITSFNFPVAVWAWNTAIATICGNTVVWKPSEKTPLCAIAIAQIVKELVMENSLPEGIFNIIIGDYRIGETMTKDERIQLISATGSTAMGKRVASVVASRLGKSILELGGNNAMIITQSANLNLALKASVFGCIGTAGQRCTTTRRLIIHESIYDKFVASMIQAYKKIKIGNPLEEDNHMGPLIDEIAVQNYLNAIEEAEMQGGVVLFGGKKLSGENYPSNLYVEPCIIEAQNHYSIVQKETFAPIVYVMKYNAFEESIAMQNDVKQGLSSAIFTQNQDEAELFYCASGSDCGLANVNLGTSGAEIGGAFGGEKETGGGRESGSDAWKAYMRRQTNTINYANDLPLAQGINFEI